MAVGVDGENILLANIHLLPVEVEFKQEGVPVPILGHLIEENGVADHHQHQGNVAVNHVQVYKFALVL